MAEDHGHRLVEMFLTLFVFSLSGLVHAWSVDSLSGLVHAVSVDSVLLSLLLFCLGCTKPCVVLCRGQGDDAGQQTTITQQPPHSDGTDYAMHGCIGSSNGRLKTSP